jgi:flagellar protein FlaG
MSFIFDLTGRLIVMASAAVNGASQPAARANAAPRVPLQVVGSSFGSTTQPQTHTKTQIQEAVDQANKAFDQSGRKLEFVVDKTLNRLIVKVVDLQTNEVLKQIPAEDMLATARALAVNSNKGALIDGLA